MIQVISPGLHTSIQDLGRFGYRNQGVPNSGVMDSISAGMANLLLNDPIENAVLEITIIGPKLLFNSDSTIVIAGAEISPKINGEKIRNNKVYQIFKGDILSFGKLIKGTRSYIAIKGGIQSEIKLKSRSQFTNITRTDKLNKNDDIKIEKLKGGIDIRKGIVKSKFSFLETNVITVFPGPEFNLFKKREIEKLLNSTYTVSINNNRMGYQMEEKIVNHSISMITSPVLPGTVQLLPSGQIVILMKDAQTTGGYPRIFQLTELSISILVQKKVGDKFKLKLAPTHI